MGLSRNATSSKRVMFTNRKPTHDKVLLHLPPLSIYLMATYRPHKLCALLLGVATKTFTNRNFNTKSQFCLCHRLTVICMGSFEVPQFGWFGELGESYGTAVESPHTSSQYVSLRRFALSAAVWPQFQCELWRPISTHIWGLGWT